MMNSIKMGWTELGGTAAFVWKERLYAVDFTTEVWLARFAHVQCVQGIHLISFI